MVTQQKACEIVDSFLDAQFLDTPGISLKLRNFREEARKQLLSYGEIPQSRDLQMI